MNTTRLSLLAVLCLALGAITATRAQTPASTPRTRPTTTMHAKGTFDVQLTPQGTPDKSDGTTMGRMTLDKQFHGDLDAVSKGEMLTALTETQGSAGYVAIERVTGKLAGRSGSFAMQHNGALQGGSQLYHAIRVVPDSGVGELVGLSGQMTIAVAADGTHSYELEYTLPAK